MLTVAGFMLRWSRMMVQLLTVLALLVAPLHMVWGHGGSANPEQASATTLYDCMKHGAQSQHTGSDSGSASDSDFPSCLGCAACAMPPLPTPLLGSEPAANDRPIVIRITVQRQAPTREIRPPRFLIV